MIHRRLSALLPHHPRQFGFTPSRSTSDAVTIVIDRINRELNEFSIVEYERPGGGAHTQHARRHRLWSRLIFRLCSTPLTMGSYSARLTDYRALATNETLAAQLPAGPLCWGMHSRTALPETTRLSWSTARRRPGTPTLPLLCGWSAAPPGEHLFCLRIHVR
ncbi:hypothetical protein TcCL_NonESM04163 [Trypanosoma cruzi]|nr:hypothetical protein TcCL_NonESM04163 [Trypanosoma cruzi]